MFRALDFFRKSATRNAEAPCSEVVEKNNLIHSPERPKSSPSSPSCPDALRRLKNAGVTVTWDDRESRVSFETVSGADQASLDSYRKAAVKVDAYLAAAAGFGLTGSCSRG